MDGEGKSQARRSRLIQVNSDNRLNHAMPGRTEKTVVVGYIYIKEKRLSPVHNRSQNFLRRSTKQTPCFNDYSPSRIGPHWSFHNFFLYLLRKKNKIGMMLVTYWNKDCFSSRISGLNDFLWGEVKVENSSCSSSSSPTNFLTDVLLLLPLTSKSRKNPASFDIKWK